MTLYSHEISRDLKKVEDIILDSVKSKSKLIENEGRRLVLAGGKRLRPALVINSAKFGEYEEDKILSLAASIELLHLATLVHDDVIDESKLRRGQRSPHDIHGNKVAIYLGDFLVTKSILLLSKYDYKANNRQNTARILKNICEGEVEQYTSKYDLNVSTTKYLKRIKFKTALLFGLSTQMGALEANCDKAIIRALRNYGMAIGTAFQIQDDILDFKGVKDKLGKPTLNDIKSGVYTLPLIYTLQNKKYKKDLEYLLSFEGHGEGLEKIRDMVYDSGGIEYSNKMLNRYVDKSNKWLNKLPDNVYKEYLKDLTNKLIDRET